MIRLLIPFCIVLLCGKLAGQTDSEIWIDAADAYENEHYQEAVELYETLLSRGIRSSELNYNLANAYFQAGDVPHAVLYYERALRYKPCDKEVINNLAIVNRQRENAVIPVSQFFLGKWIRNVASWCTAACWGILSILLLWTTLGLVAWRVRHGKNAVALRLTWLFGLLTVCSIALGGERLHMMRSDTSAIVMSPTIEVHVAPDPDSKITGIVSEGEKVRILDSLENYFKVRLPNYEVGWMEQGALERI